MASDAFEQLLDAMGLPLGPRLSGKEVELELLASHGERGAELAGLLLARNGSYSHARSLLLRPLASAARPRGVVEWNDPAGWRAAFKADLTGALFFAEDLFGEQFALREDAVWRFDGETGEWSPSAPTLHAWAAALLDEEGRPDLESPLAVRWQAKHGEIPDGARLRPPVPFLFEESADATLDDYRPVPEDEVMAFLATIANQLHGVADGEQVVLRRTNEAGPAKARTSKRRWWWPF